MQSRLNLESKLHKDSPIGIFDSGIGGLTIAKAIHDVLPQERLIYYGDTKHLPYGDKSLEAIYGYAKNITQFLIDEGCKIVVIACNSASSAAYERLAEEYAGVIPIINVIDPMVDYVLENNYREIGVIATKATINSGIFTKKIAARNADIKIWPQATPLLAPMIEDGFYNGLISKTVIETYLSHEKFNDIDALLLACTHYPLIRDEIYEFFDGRVNVMDATILTAQAVKDELTRLDLHRTAFDESQNRFLVSDFTEAFERTARIFYGEKVHLETVTLNEYYKL